MKLLDLFCGAGGAAMGYSLAGFTEIVGVDIRPQKHYPFTFVQGNAFEYLASHGHEFDLIHASPPCQRYTRTSVVHRADHPDLLPVVLRILRAMRRPYVVENVPDAWRLMEASLVLCGTQFGLPIQRHRLFETYHRGIFPLRLSCNHGKRAIYITGTPRRHGMPRKTRRWLSSAQPWAFPG